MWLVATVLADAILHGSVSMSCWSSMWYDYNFIKTFNLGIIITMIIIIMGCRVLW